MNWKFYLTGGDAWEAMMAECLLAKESIDIEQFIFDIDHIGHEFIKILERKKTEGVKIRILCDAVGSYSFLNSATEQSLERQGIEVKFYNPVKPWRIGNFSSWFLRNHRKLLIVDGRVVHTGGVGITDRMKNWRDTNIRLEGGVVKEASAVFEQMWLVAPRHKFSQFKTIITEDTDFSFLVNSPRYRGRYIYKNLLRTIKDSKKYLYITTPYFVPSIRIFSALNRAAKRGVDVRLLLPKYSDVHTADIAAGSYFILALRAGIKIYLYEGGRVLHSKTGVSDDVWGSIGSANMDNLSLLLNHEGNIIGRNPEFIDELKNQFFKDIAESKLLLYEDWKKRPFLRKVLEFVSWPIHGVL